MCRKEYPKLQSWIIHEMLWIIYTVTKKEKGFTVLKGAPSNPNHRFRITLHKLEKMDEAFGNINWLKRLKRT